MNDIPQCPKCGSEYTYFDGSLFVCPDCAHEFNATDNEPTEENTVAKDSNGVPKEVMFVLTVVHDNKPTVTLNGSLPKTAKVNESIAVPEATVNYFEQGLNNHYYVYVISPTYDIEIVKDNSFTAKEQGEYTVRYFVLDTYGNYEIVDYKIQVTK